MKHVGIREFRDRASHYLASREVLTVERHGRPIGFYIPVAPGTADRTPRRKRAPPTPPASTTNSTNSIVPHGSCALLCGRVGESHEK